MSREAIESRVKFLRMTSDTAEETSRPPWSEHAVGVKDSTLPCPSCWMDHHKGRAPWVIFRNSRP
jgi:hypothetical protein